MRLFWLLLQYDIQSDTFRAQWREAVERPILPGCYVSEAPLAVEQGQAPADVLHRIRIVDTTLNEIG